MSKLLDKINNHRRLVLILVDAIIAIVTYFSAFLLSGFYDYDALMVKLGFFSQHFWLYTLIYVGSFVVFGQYKKMWRYAGVEDIFSCLKTSFIANSIFTLVTLIFRLSIRYYVYWVIYPISMLLSTSVRIVFRSLLILNNKSKKDIHNIKNTMIIGAGEATAAIISELDMVNPENLNIVCILDDDKSKIGRKLSNIPVIATTADIIKSSIEYDIEQIIFCIPSCDSENRKRILDLCSKTKCKVRIVSSLVTIIGDKDRKMLDNLRDIEIEDLLGRESIKLDNTLSREYIENKTVMVTGGGGSIGSELSRQIASYSPKKLIIFDIYENNAYNIQQELIRKYKAELNLSIEIGSVRDLNKLEQIFHRENIDIVFHAAAHKHVPLMETNPEEAIKNNVIGSYNVSKTAGKYGVDKFVLISTDKAVNPTNVMGATKRIAELIIQAMSKEYETDYVAVRFGNVLGSNGSVIPLFVDQIKQGGPVTVTHPDITRFFMTIPEAVSLVLQAGAIASGGEIFVLDMGQAVKIKDLAYNLIRLSGLEPNVDVEVVFTGLRPGEKLYEELLINRDKNQSKTDIEKIYIEKPIIYERESLLNDILSLKDAADKLAYHNELEIIKRIVPSYKHETYS